MKQGAVQFETIYNSKSSLAYYLFCTFNKTSR